MKNLRRAFRYHPVTEKMVSFVKGRNEIDFSELGFSVPVGAGDIVIDCGANVGDLTTRFARTGATVHAFEPNPLCFDILSRRFSAFPNVFCHNQGVMDRACTLHLDTPETHEQFDKLDVTVAASFVNKSFDVPVKSVEVECIDLAAFIAALDRPVKLLKMDIEGAEVAVLNHLLDVGLLETIGLTVVETHERFSEELAAGTKALEQRIAAAGLASRVRLDWF